MPEAAPLHTARIFIVEDDAAVRKAVGRIVERAGWTSMAFATGAEFLDLADDAQPGCVILDLHGPGLDGFAIQCELLARRIQLPIIVLTGRGSVTSAVQAMMAGATDYLEKPVQPDLLTWRVASAIREHSRRLETARAAERLAPLTSRELEICSRLAAGKQSKEIARDLALSVRTIEHHRERILSKTHAANTAELAALYAIAALPQALRGGHLTHA